MIYLRLFTAFIKIGFTSFGGMSMIPVIMQEMKVNQWMTAEDLCDFCRDADGRCSGWDCSGYWRADASLYADAWRSGVLRKVPRQ